MKRAFVTGGSGFLGGRLIEMLVRQGVEVAALARSDAAREKVEARGARAVAGDLSSPDALLADLQGTDVVFHSAAFLHFWGDWDDFVAVHRDATAGLIDVAKRAGVRRFILVSAASVVMREMTPILNVDETAPLTNLRHLPYSATKAMAERAAVTENSGSMAVVAVRPPLIWGPGDTFDHELGDKIRAGQFAYFDGGRFPYSVCHVDNACHGVILAAERGCGGEAYFIADSEITEARDFLSERIEAASMKPPSISVPSRLAWALAGVMEGVWRLFRFKSEPPITREVVRLLGAAFTITLKKAETELGYRPLLTRAQGMAALKASQPHRQVPAVNPVHAAGVR